MQYSTWTTTTIPVPLPTEKEVCLTSITDKRTNAEQIEETHVIRIVAKAATLEGKKDSPATAGKSARSGRPPRGT